MKKSSEPCREIRHGSLFKFSRYKVGIIYINPIFYKQLKSFIFNTFRICATFLSCFYFHMYFPFLFAKLYCHLVYCMISFQIVSPTPNAPGSQTLFATIDSHFFPLWETLLPTWYFTGGIPL